MFNRVKTVTSVLCLVVLCMVLPVTASASERVSKYVSDSTIKSIVERNLEKHHLTAKDGANVQVDVDDHVIVLSGTVPSLKLMREAEKQAWRANNGVRVENHLSVANARKTDDQLAEEVAHAIRLYSRYDIFDWVDGNVRNGVVSLTGAVRQPYRPTTKSWSNKSTASSGSTTNCACCHCRPLTIRSALPHPGRSIVIRCSHLTPFKPFLRFTLLWRTERSCSKAWLPLRWKSKWLKLTYAAM